jgi:hypothetical protein
MCCCPDRLLQTSLGLGKGSFVASKVETLSALLGTAASHKGPAGGATSTFCRPFPGCIVVLKAHACEISQISLGLLAHEVHRMRQQHWLSSIVQAHYSQYFTPMGSFIPMGVGEAITYHLIDTEFLRLDV